MDDFDFISALNSFNEKYLPKILIFLLVFVVGSLIVKLLLKLIRKIFFFFCCRQFNCKITVKANQKNY